MNTAPVDTSMVRRDLAECNTALSDWYTAVTPEDRLHRALEALMRAVAGLTYAVEKTAPTTELELVRLPSGDHAWLRKERVA